MRILIVAKDARNRTSITNRLHGVGYYPTASFARGREALVYAQHHHADLVIAARNLRDMEGPTLARALELQGQGGLPLLMICDRIRQDELLNALDQGVDNVLLTPFDQTDLKEKISSLTNRPTPAANGTVFWEEPEDVSALSSEGQKLQVH